MDIDQDSLRIWTAKAVARLMSFVQIACFFPCARLQASPVDRPTPLMAQTKRPDTGHISYMFSIKTFFKISPFLRSNF